MLYGWAYPVPAGMSTMPTRLHAVGNVVEREGQQIRLGLPGNNFATITPEVSGQMTITQITRGSSLRRARAILPSCCPSRSLPGG